MQLQEGPYQMPYGRGTRQRWVQRVFVIRNDEVAKHLIDLGPVADFEGVTPLIMPSEGTNTVAQLQEHAEKNRHDDYWRNRRQEMLAESTLVQNLLRQEEEVLAVKRNRTTSGPLITRERSGYPAGAVERVLKERLHAP